MNAHVVGRGYRVLILVLVEHTLGVYEKDKLDAYFSVLILVLVEHTLGGRWQHFRLHSCPCLNPCFSGTYSRSCSQEEVRTVFGSLNPCFSGTYSRRRIVSPKTLLPLRLNPCFSGTYSRRTRLPVNKPFYIGLNPCFSGTYSRRRGNFKRWKHE